MFHMSSIDTEGDKFPYNNGIGTTFLFKKKKGGLTVLVIVKMIETAN